MTVDCVTWQVFEAMNQLRQQMDQQKLEFDEERERLHSKMSEYFSRHVYSKLTTVFAATNTIVLSE